MSWEKHDDNCPGCRPAMVDIQTGKVLPETHPAMVEVLKVWAKTTLQEREVWHRVTCQNSTKPDDLKEFKMIAAKMQMCLDASQN